MINLPMFFITFLASYIARLRRSCVRVSGCSAILLDCNYSYRGHKSLMRLSPRVLRVGSGNARLREGAVTSNLP